MPNLDPIEIRAFVPAKDFELSCRFYQDFGFELISTGHGVAYFRLGSASFLLQDFYRPELAENFVMQLLVHDTMAWHNKLTESDLSQKFSTKISTPERQPWGMLAFTLLDPSGVLWRISQQSAESNS